MQLEIIKKFNFSDDDLTCLFSVLLKLEKESKKVGFNKVIKLDKVEIAFCQDVLDELMRYFGYEKKDDKHGDSSIGGNVLEVSR